MFWLPPNTVPTMGNYFREAGYQTYYKGKWHISNEDLLVPGTHDSTPSYDPATGMPNPPAERLYVSANPLDAFGFSSWIGPEPHGRNPRNSASSAAVGLSDRDVVFGSEAAGLIEALDRQKLGDADARPWLVVASFVNPHDITLYGALTAHQPSLFRFQVDPMPDVPPPPTIAEALHTKPSCQASYRDTYPRAIQPIGNEPFYRKLYYQLQKNADRQMTKVLDALDRSSFRDDTIVVFTSDHGELLGAHGNLHQKMYCAYEEVLHVPALIHNKRLFPHKQNVSELTSHVDLLPTMLGLAGADIPGIQRRLRSRFSEVRPFVGRDLAPCLLGRPAPGSEAADRSGEPVFFMTDDDITRGQHQINPLGRAYASVEQPNHIETVIADLPGRHGSPDRQWKFSRYFDNDRFWSEPGVRDITIQLYGDLCADPKQASSAGSQASCKTVPVPEQFELYNLTEDPLETRNLAHPAWATPQSEIVRLHMARLLQEQRSRKRLRPERDGHR